MSYEVMLVDFFGIQDSEKRLELVARLRELAAAEHDEFPDSTLSTYLWTGARLFNTEISAWEEIKLLEEHAVLLWAGMAICDTRMSSASMTFLIDSRVGKTDPSNRVNNNISIKKAFREQFDAYINDAGISLQSDNAISEGFLVRRDMRTDRMTPDSVQHAPNVLATKIIGVGTTTLDVEWERAEITDFAAYHLYISTTPNLAYSVRNTAETNRGVREDVTLAGSFDQLYTNAAQITGLTAGTDYWIVLAVEDYNGKIALSKEIYQRTA